MDIVLTDLHKWIYLMTLFSSRSTALSPPSSQHSLLHSSTGLTEDNNDDDDDDDDDGVMNVV